MGVPDAAQVNSRTDAAVEKIMRLKAAHDIFISEWAKIEKEEKNIMAELGKFLDSTRIQNILSTIKTIKQ